MTRVLFDTNVLLDVLLDREPFVRDAAPLLASVYRGEIEGVICATTVTTLFYIGRKNIGAARTREYLRRLHDLFDFAAVDRFVLEKALAASFVDFEDAVLHEAALGAGAALIVTRNVADFSGATLSVLSPAELRQRLARPQT